MSYTGIHAVFQTKVIEHLQPQELDSHSSSASDEDMQPTHLKRQKLQTDDKVHKGTVASDQLREREAIRIQKQHDKFMKVQAKLAGKYVERKRALSTVSSKLPVENTPSSSLRQGMEGKGARVVPQVVKNYRKKLKKKRGKMKQGRLDPPTAERTT